MPHPLAPRATIHEGNYGCICECGAMKTDQALTCFACAVERRRAPDYWERRTCPECGGPKDHRRQMCRPCRNESMVGVSVASGRPQPQDHRWRKPWAA